MNDQITPTKSKLCIDCRWHEEVAGEYGTGHVCKHAESEADKGGPKWDVVVGTESSPFDRYRACGTMREYRICGPEAKLFEPKD